LRSKAANRIVFVFYAAVVESFESRSVDNLLFLQNSLEAVDLFMQL